MTMTEFFKNEFAKHKDMVQLQGYGWTHAKPADEFEVGDVMLCNYGHTQEVVDVKPCGKTMVHLFVRCSDGKVYDKRCKRETLYAYKK